MSENRKRKIELLAPAKNLECGMAAIDHGADAIYIGASEFGARKSAGNSIDDIASLVEYAHKFGVGVFVTMNTIVYEQELEEAKRMLRKLVDIGVDAILVQDMAVVRMFEEIAAENPGRKMPQLHASTQTDNRNTEKVRWLSNMGFSRVVLARELSLDEIEAIHKANPGVELEVFVHGALCVSYSGACYASYNRFGRSANRGGCAQFCRLAFNLVDSNGDVIERDKHILSLKDLNQIERLGDIIEAGASSLKIEGRLKDANYVKNVVAAYSEKLNAFISQHSEKYCRSSYGKATYTFAPNIKKTFNRGFTHYFLDGRKPDIASINTPKAVGEYVGYVKEIRHKSFNVAGTATFANGDGLCFFGEDGKLEGFRVNRAENNRLYPLTMPYNLRPGMKLYRNNDIEFEREMSGKTATRKLSMGFAFYADGGKVLLRAKDETGRKAEILVDEQFEPAQKPQTDNIKRQMEKLGNTQFAASDISISDDVARMFIPSSRLASLRREIIAAIESQPIASKASESRPHSTSNSHEQSGEAVEASEINVANVANHMAEEFYAKHGVRHAPAAVETMAGGASYGGNPSHTPLMTCRYCIRYSLGFCVKRGGKQPSWHEPLFIESADKKRMRVVFNCGKCQMELYEQK